MQRKVGITKFGTSFTVHALPVLRDNFSYIIHDHKTDIAAVVDVAEVRPVVDYLTSMNILSSSTTAGSSSASSAAEKFAVLTTHKHWDHSGGNREIAKQYGASLKVYGGAKDNVPAVTHPVEDKDVFTVGSLEVRVFFSPCHTSGHVLYYVHDPSDVSAGSALFSGDTLFVGGIGAFFEGNSKDMVSILDRVASELPKETKVFCGHEYTCNFIKFALTIDPQNVFIQHKLKEFQSLVAEGKPTIPSTLEDESKFNVFMRTRDPVVAAAVGKAGANAVDVMEALYNACP